MGNIDINFKPSVDVFDANVSLGRRHNRRVRIDSVDATIEVMDQSGVGKALTYSAHAADFDSRDGNDLLMEMIKDQPRLVPQFVCNPAFDDFDSFSSQVADLKIRSVRMLPQLHNYPFKDWILEHWLEWLTEENIPIWVAAQDVDPSSFFDTINSHPKLKIVLCEVHYRHAPWALHLLKALPSVRVEISRFVITNGIRRLIDIITPDRIIFGSRFPDSAMSPQIYNLHHSGLSNRTLSNICSNNLVRLISEE